MARWKLVEPHYIHAERDGVRPEWVYKEINRANGREVQKKYIVPMHLDPKNASDWNDWPDGPHGDGIVVVTNGKGAKQRDIVLVADSKGNLPITHGMEPLDDEAIAITAEYQKTHPYLEGREEATYSERLLDKFIEQLADTKTAATAQTSVQGFDEVLKAMTAMMEQNQKILSTLVERDLKRKVA